MQKKPTDARVSNHLPLNFFISFSFLINTLPLPFLLLQPHIHILLLHLIIFCLLFTPKDKMRTIPSSFSQSSSLAPAASLLSPAQRSPWHSPIPYLFGGLAAMLGLIAFALLILACSYWKLSGFLQGEEGSGRDLERGDAQKQSNFANKETVKVFEEKILIIMAGDENPTFLATPVCCKPSSFGDGNCKVGGVEDHGNSEKPEKETECENQQGNQDDEQQQNQQ